MGPHHFIQCVVHGDVIGVVGRLCDLKRCIISGRHAGKAPDNVVHLTFGLKNDAATVGKAVGKDSDAGKATFVSLLGLDAAKSRAADLVQQACDALEPYGEDADMLRDAAQFIITRDK